jgi:hypothetical protein
MTTDSPGNQPSGDFSGRVRDLGLRRVRRARTIGADSAGNRFSSDFSGRILDQGEHLVREGTVQRVLIKRGEETIVQLPIIVAILLAVVVPWLVAGGAVVALVNRCTITLQRAHEEPAPDTPLDTTSEASAESPEEANPET